MLLLRIPPCRFRLKTPVKLKRQPLPEHKGGFSMNQITIKDKKYPVAFTMGAALEFRKASGKEVDQANGLSDMGVLLYACAKSTSRAQGVKFNLSLEEFCDNLTIDAMEVVNQIMPGAVQAETVEPDKGGKKSRVHRDLGVDGLCDSGGGVKPERSGFNYPGRV